MLATYSALFNLKQIYGDLEGPQQDSYKAGSYQGSNHIGLNIPPHLQPEVLSLSAQKLGSDLKSEVSCLINAKLSRCIDNLVDTLNKRLEATRDLIDVSQQLEIVRNNLG